MRAKFNGLELHSVYVGCRAMVSDDSGQSKSRHHVVTVRNKENFRTRSFDYYPCIAHPTIDSDNELIEALECFVGDANAGRYCNNIDEFVDEFGYSTDTTKVSTIIKVYESCKSAYGDLMYLYDGDSDKVNGLVEALEESLS